MFYLSVIFSLKCHICTTHLELAALQAPEKCLCYQEEIIKTLETITLSFLVVLSTQML